MVYLLNLVFEYLDTYFRLALVLGAVETAIFGVSLAHEDSSVLELIKQAFMGVFNCFFDSLVVMFRVRVRESLCCFLEEEKNRLAYNISAPL